MKNINKVIICIALLCMTSLAFAEHTDAHTKDMKNSDRAMKECDTNKDGKVSRDEYLAKKTVLFDEYDKNKDNVLDAQEHYEMFNAIHEKMMAK